MLSANKVKLHGMRDERWTIKDKVTQYRGLINLYGRDRVIIENDSNKTRKRQIKELRSLRKEVKEKRDELDNALKGDAQGLRNTLQEHRSIKLAFQELPPNRVIDHMKQVNHTKKKEIDKLQYKKERKTHELVSLKLEQAELEDRIRFDSPGDIKEEKMQQIVIGKMQDALIKEGVAVSIRKNFLCILEIMKKDALYFDSVLVALNVDSINQAKCMYRTTQLGQLATEYLDDRRQEYKILEKAIKKSMKERERSLRIVREDVEELSSNLRHLVRRESDVNLIKKPDKTLSEMNLQSGIDELDKTLDQVQEVTMVSTYNDIFPRMQDQIKQKERLHELVEKVQVNRDTMLEYKHHAREMYDKLVNYMVDGTYDYRAKKKQLLQETKETLDTVNMQKQEIEKCGALFVTIRRALQQLFEMLHCVGSPSETRDYRALSTVDSDTVLIPEPMEENAFKLLSFVTSKLQTLMSFKVDYEGAKKEDAVRIFQHVIMDKADKLRVVAEIAAADVSLLEGLELEDASVPTRTEIKNRSKIIVEENSKSDIEKLAASMPSKSKGKPKKWI